MKATQLSLVLTAVLAVSPLRSAAEPLDVSGPVTFRVVGNPTEARNSGWSVAFDNDVLARPDSDQDYTGGFSVELNGRRATEYPLSVNRALEWINGRFDRQGRREALPTSHAIQLGVLLFTPDDFRKTRTRAGDRPFANLVFFGNSQFTLDARAGRAYQTTLTVGILGSGIGELLQSTVHRAAGSATPVGYERQISDGGELTARYTFARQSLITSRRTPSGRAMELKFALEGSVGYLTEGSATIAARWGATSSPWWQFAPTLSNYLRAPTPRLYKWENGARESYFWASATLRAKAYDSFLRGQFRDSLVTHSSSDIDHIVGELSMGWTVTLSRDLTFSQSIHYQTQQIRRGAGARDHAWGSFSVARSF